MIDAAKAAMLAEAGFQPVWLRDAKEGDTVYFTNLKRQGEEWTIQSIWDTPRGDGGVVRNMVVRFPDGHQEHRSLGYEWECWILAKED
jgi:hypothetical protein